MNELLAAFGIKKTSIVAGGLGAALALKFLKELSWKDRLYTAALSFPLAIIGGEAAQEAFELGPKTSLLVMVVLGAVGVAALSAFFNGLPAMIEAGRKKILGS